jgi:ferric-dicitrate binding protein FerR (iron transport regulator)
MSDRRDTMEVMWERLRSAQDQALAAPGEDAPAERALVTQLTGPRPARRRSSRGWGRLRALGLGLGLASSAALVAVLFLVPGALRRPAGPIAGGAPAPSGPTLVAEAGSELPLRFPDGSTVTFLPGSSGQVLRREAANAEVEIRGGRLEAHVVHAPGVRWVVRAGPFRVHVTGTRFGVDWSATAGVLAVTLREGSVVVDGGVLGAGVPLRAGQRLRVGLDGVVRTEPAPLATSAGGAGETTEAGAATAAASSGVGRVGSGTAAAIDHMGHGGPPAAGGARSEPEWRALAERGAYREALRVAERAGLEAQLAALDARGLLALGDVARYAGAPGTATRTFERLVSRFPRDRLAGDAVFSLGRLCFEDGRADRAAVWFARYVQRWPGGPLAEQAAGRLVESTAKAGQGPAARRAARSYLQRAPQGTYAALARSILEGRDPGEAASP